MDTDCVAEDEPSTAPGVSEARSTANTELLKFRVHEQLLVAATRSGSRHQGELHDHRETKGSEAILRVLPSSPLRLVPAANKDRDSRDDCYGASPPRAPYSGHLSVCAHACLSKHRLDEA
jgi:hypothetical protein